MLLFSLIHHTWSTMSSSPSPSATESPMALDLHTLVLSLAWTCLHDTPSNQKNVLYDELLKSEFILEDVASAHPFEFAPGLHEVLTSDALPTTKFFKTLPGDAIKGWGIYMIILCKPGYPPRVYIGSATEADRGVIARWYNYDIQSPIPKYIRQSLQEGYTIDHRGLICWTPSIPTPALQPMIRLFCVLLEATFAYIFWAMRTPKKKDFSMSHLCPWDRLALEYTGLCSHCCLYEGVRNEFEPRSRPYAMPDTTKPR